MSKKVIYVDKTKSEARYEIKQSGKKYLVYHVKGIFDDVHKKVGEANSLEDALMLVKAHSGAEIKSIS